MSQSRKPALAKLLTTDPHAATTRRIAVAEVEEALRKSMVETRLLSGTRKIVSATEIAEHLALRRVADSETDEGPDDGSVDVKLDSLAPPPIQRPSPLTPIVVTGIPRRHDPNRTTLSRAQVPTVAIVLLVSSALLALLGTLSYLLR